MPSPLPPGSPPLPGATFIFGKEILHVAFFDSGLTLEAGEMFRSESTVIRMTAGGGKKSAAVVSQVLVYCLQLLLLKPESVCCSSGGQLHTKTRTASQDSSCSDCSHRKFKIDCGWKVEDIYSSACECLDVRVRARAPVCVCVSACVLQSHVHSRHLPSRPC